MTDPNDKRQHLERLSNEELIDILLKHDESRRQQEVFDIVEEILIERGSSSGKPLNYAAGPEKAREETAGLNLITVAEYVSHLDAEADRLILEGEGLRAWIFEDNTPLPEGFPPSVQLKVCAENWHAAIEKLASIDEEY